MSQVIIRIPPDGKPIEVETRGVPGGNCRLASDPYLKKMAGETISDRPTADAYLPEGEVKVTLNTGSR